MGDVIGTYAAYAKNDRLRLDSSSGAVFSLLAEWILRQYGVVYGVAMSQDCRYAEFVRVDDQCGLPRLRGSKYLQAKIGNTYQRVKADLESGLTILFSGTGCQVNGLKGFLGKEYNNLYCVDVICHGVPSPELWREYVEYNEEKKRSKLVSINFRCKDDSWIDFGIKRINKNHRAMYVSKDKDPFMLMFLRDYCLRPSCYECVAKGKKLSDLTIADFWGVDKIVSGMNDGKGVSLVITRTDKGQYLFDDISGDMILQKVSYEDGVKSNQADYSSVVRPVERDCFFEDMKALPFDELKKKYGTSKPIPLKKRIKKTVKKILMKNIYSKINQRGKVKGQTYGLLFTFEEI